MRIVSITLFWRVSWHNRVLQNFAASHPFGIDQLNQGRSKVVIDTTLFSRFTSASTLTPTLSLVIVVLLLYVHGHVGTVTYPKHTVPWQLRPLKRLTCTKVSANSFVNS